MASNPSDTVASARLAQVLEHVRLENEHDLDAVMRTFGGDGFYDDTPWGDRRAGLAGVRSYYGEMFRAAPDLHIEVVSARTSEDAVILEVRISGTHVGTWRGLPGTGRRFEIPLCGIFTFDAENKLAGERIYYDRASVLRQLGVFSEPDTVHGKVLTSVTHPVTMLRIAARAASGANRARKGRAAGSHSTS
jgi:steroid delta-isomerase-like uncharacterized protein